MQATKARLASNEDLIQRQSYAIEQMAADHSREIEALRNTLAAEADRAADLELTLNDTHNASVGCGAVRGGMGGGCEMELSCVVERAPF